MQIMGYLICLAVWVCLSMLEYKVLCHMRRTEDTCHRNNTTGIRFVHADGKGDMVLSKVDSGLTQRIDACLQIRSIVGNIRVELAVNDLNADARFCIIDDW